MGENGGLMLKLGFEFGGKGVGAGTPCNLNSAAEVGAEHFTK